jgi:hypothetical protein
MKLWKEVEVNLFNLLDEHIQEEMTAVLKEIDKLNSQDSEHVKYCSDNQFIQQAVLMMIKEVRLAFLEGKKDQAFHNYDPFWVHFKIDP